MKARHGGKDWLEWQDDEKRPVVLEDDVQVEINVLFEIDNEGYFEGKTGKAEVNQPAAVVGFKSKALS